MSVANNIEQPAVPNHNDRAQRAPRGAGSISVDAGKVFTRIVDANICLSTVVDYGLGMWKRMDTNKPEPNDNNSRYLCASFLRLETIYNNARGEGSTVRTLKAALQDASGGRAFRKSLLAKMADGRTQARSDDASELRKLIATHPSFEECKVLGWGDDRCAALLKTKETDLTNAEQLTLKQTEVPHGATFAGLYTDHKFPTDPALPFENFMQSDEFVACCQTIYTGLGTAFGKAGSGTRSKASKADMTSFGAATLAYAAMMLRFVLSAPGDWYTVPIGRRLKSDKRYNYDAFYVELIRFVSKPVFEDDFKEVCEYMNLIVFPNAHEHPDRIHVPEDGSMAQLAAEAEATRAAQRAASRAAAEEQGGREGGDD